MGMFVDDLVITGANNIDLDTFKAEMQATFKMSDLGLLHYYLGLTVS